MKRSKI